ncbi:MAG: D,D-heptose 1,7-bisphosphate phosphatase, partial [Selenomonas artemidis]
MPKNKAIFFDRDGTLNVDVDYLHDPADFVWTEGAIDA